MTHPLDEYPFSPDPHITLEQIDAIEKTREEGTFIDPYEDMPSSAIIPRALREFAGLSRQCMQSDEQKHLFCIAGTRNSCTCLCHEENRTVEDDEIEGLLT